MTSRDLAGVTRDKTENGEFCLLPAVLFFFFFCITSSVKGGGEEKQS